MTRIGFKLGQNDAKDLLKQDWVSFLPYLVRIQNGGQNTLTYPSGIPPRDQVLHLYEFFSQKVTQIQVSSFAY